MILDELCDDLTAKALRGNVPRLVGRDKEIQQLVNYLNSNNQRCILIVGQPGTGKSALVEALAQQISTGQTPLSKHQILQLDLNALVAGTKYRGELEERITKVIKEAATNANIILFIDEFHNIDKSGGFENNIIAESLKPYLARNEISIIGATTIQDYDQLIQRDSALVRRFVKLELAEMSKEATMAVIRNLTHEFSANTGLIFDDSALQLILDITDRYIRNQCFPDKAISAVKQVISDKVPVKPEGSSKPSLKDSIAFAEHQIALLEKKEYEKSLQLLDSWLGLSKGNADRVISLNDVKKSLSSMCKVPLADMDGDSFDRRILTLGASLKELVIGQDRAVKAVADCFKRMAVGLRRPNAPIGSFLFIGPTGVGKTELAKSLAKALWGSQDRMIRFDMSEYMEEHNVSKLIGAPPGYVGHDEPGLLTKAIADNPYSVVLFDEVEKAHPRITNILLQLLDDGRLTDAKGRIASFADAVVIMTSNIASKEITELGREGLSEHYDDFINAMRLKLSSNFSPEFINRVDQIAIFSPLTQKELLPIFHLITAKYGQLILQERGIGLEFSQKAFEYIISSFYEPEMGARSLRRALENAVYSNLSEKILEGQFHGGDRILIDCNLNNIIFSKVEK